MKQVFVIVTGIAALAAAAVGLATAVSTSAVDPISATLAVRSSAQSSVQACASNTGDVVAGRIVAEATASSSEALLRGPARLSLSGRVDRDANAGTFTGTLTINVASGPDTVASFSGVYANGELHGLLTGRAGLLTVERQGVPSTTRGSLAPTDRLVANMSANLNVASGQLSSVRIGQADGGGAAVLVAPGTSCGSASSSGRAPNRP
jgi:hypothetical protein